MSCKKTAIALRLVYQTKMLAHKNAMPISQLRVCLPRRRRFTWTNTCFAGYRPSRSGYQIYRRLVFSPLFSRGFRSFLIQFYSRIFIFPLSVLGILEFHWRFGISTCAYWHLHICLYIYILYHLCKLTLILMHDASMSKSSALSSACICLPTYFLTIYIPYFTASLPSPHFHVSSSHHHSISPTPSLSQQSPALSYIDNLIFAYSSFVTLAARHLFSP